MARKRPLKNAVHSPGPVAAVESQGGPAPIDFLAVPEDERDRVWLERVYRGGEPQATPRAIIMGMFLGGIMSLSNLYVGLKTGWGLGVALTSCILSYAIWNTFRTLGLAKTQLTILENNCMQSTAACAGSSTGSTLVSAVAAFLIITGKNMPFGVLLGWTAFLALLGVSMAVPMKRQMINREQLRFPSGVAAAETLRSLYASGEEAMLKARSLFWSMGAGAVIKWLVEGQAGLMEKLAASQSALSRVFAAWGAKIAIPGELPWSTDLLGGPAGRFGLATPVDPKMMAAGAIVGLRTAVSMAVGALVLYGILGPWAEQNHVFTEMKALHAIASDATSAGNVRKWGLWTGSSMMVTAGLTAFAFQWRSIARAFAGIGSIFGQKKETGPDLLASIEVPNSWVGMGLLVSGGGCVALMWSQYGISPWLGTLAVALTFVLALVACRATGETDITPIGAMGKVTQLAYGIAIPQNPIANLMTANVTAGAAAASADLLTDLKSGYLLGANPRQQTIAQAMGIIAGTVVVVPVWYVLVPDASHIGADSKHFAAPAAEVWASVAKLLANGLNSLHPSIVMGMIVGGAVGVALPVLDKVLPERVRRFLPSATGLGLSFVIGFADSIAFLIGAVVAELFTRWKPKQADTYVVPVSSGIIAGESLMGIVIAILQATGKI